jgi:(1->4)-alpha-D-glucan 1-alpha-D-glucosylmutase
MLTTSTHDTKRAEDVRLRINLLSEIPARWSQKVTEWINNNEKYRIGEFPDRNTEYFLYQTLVGASPIGKQRLTDYMIKAVREAKVHTSWKDTNAEYENIIKGFISDIYSDDKFIESLNKFVDTLLEPAWISSLSQTLLKYTAPGIPDLYQGTELWDLSLVDPDNRRAVDYGRRKKMLEEVKNMSPKQATEKIHTGITKMYVIYNALKVRRQYLESFGSKSSYESVDTGGGKAGHLIAFERNGDIVTVVPRLLLGLESGWDNTAVTLPRGKWMNVFTKECFQGTVCAGDLFERFPVALLTVERS